MWPVGLMLLQLFTLWNPQKDEAWVDVAPSGKRNDAGFLRLS